MMFEIGAIFPTRNNISCGMTVVFQNASDIRWTEDDPAGMSIQLDHCDRGRQLIGRRKKYRAPIEAIGLLRKTASREDIAESYTAVRSVAVAAIELTAR